MKSKYATITFLLIIVLIFSACSKQDISQDQSNNIGQNGNNNQVVDDNQGVHSDNSNQNTVSGHNRPCGHDGQNRIRQISAPVIQELTNVLEGKVTILSLGILDKDLRVYARLFSEAHPNVQINIETTPFPHDMAQSSALMTRLQTTPPDIFLYNSASMNHEKIEMATIFADLYDLFDGSRGIDENDYFFNIFRASETHGRLYSLPIHITYNIEVLNKRLFDGVGVDTSQIKTLSIDEEIDLFFRVSEAFPGEKIYLYDHFSIIAALDTDPIYDIDTGTVFVNTPEMKERLELAMRVPVNNRAVQYSPDGIMFTTVTNNEDIVRSFITYNSRNMLMPINDLGGLRIFTGSFLQKHMDTSLSQPIIRLSGICNHLGFGSERSLSLMREAPNSDLAWEFIRFVMEYEDDLYHGGMSDYVAPINTFPINRTRFEKQVYEVLKQVALEAYTFSGFRQTLNPALHERVDEIIEENSELFNEENLSPERRMNRAVDMALEELWMTDIVDVMDFLRGNMEMIAYEIRLNSSVIMSLVYPDVWLLYSGQQDVSRTLASIQNRLELYVNE